MDFTKTIEIAQLALKHRPNKNQKQRIIAIIYSPLAEEASVLTNLAKKAKKNGVAVDLINIGARENLEKLQSFIESVNNADNSHLVHIDIGAASVADVVISSPITQGAVPTGEAIGGAAAADMGRIDPNIDPELAEAIRQSLEEQKQMLQPAEPKAEEKKEAQQQPRPEAVQPAQAQSDDAFAGLTEEEIMQRAIMLSLEGKQEEVKEEPQPEVPAPIRPFNPDEQTTTVTHSIPQPPAPEKMEVPMAPKKEEKKTVDLEAELLKNRDFVNELIKDLPEMTEEDKMKVISSLSQKETKKQENKKDEPKKDSMEDIKPSEKKH